MKTYALILILFIVRTGYSQTNDDILNVLVQRKLISQGDADSLRSKADAKKKSFFVSASKSIQLAGYTQIRYQNLEQAGRVDGFDVRRARLDIKGSISQYFSYRLQPEFAGASARLLDAFAEVKLADYFILTIGQQKVALSYESQIADNKAESIDRSQVVEALVARSRDIIGNHNGRDIGIQANGGLFKINDRTLIDYYVGLYNGAGFNVGENNSSKDVAARLILHPVKGLALGGSFYDGVGSYENEETGELATTGRTRWGTELNFEKEKILIRGEYLQGKDLGITKAGFYVLAGYYVLPQKIQVIGKFDNYDPNTNKSGNISAIYTLGINFLFNANAKLQLAYNLREEEGAKVSNNFATAQFQIGF